MSDAALPRRTVGIDLHAGAVCVVAWRPARVEHLAAAGPAEALDAVLGLEPSAGTVTKAAVAGPEPAVAGLREALAARLGPAEVRRDGAGLLCDADPAETLRLWDPVAVLALVGVREVPEDRLGALVCALVARAVRAGLTAGPPLALGDRPQREGWVHLPVPGALDRLAELG